MNVDNKPETVADPNVTPEPSTEQVIQQRMAEARQQIEGIGLIPKNPTGGNADVSTQGGSSIDNNTNVIDLKKIEASAGRKFDSFEDVDKYIKNLNSLVGDQEVANARKAADKLSLLEKNLGSTELNRLLLGLTSQPSQVVTPEQSKPQPVESKPQPTEVKSSSDEVTQRLEKLEEDNQLRTLEKVHPNAMIVADLIALKAKADGVSYVVAFEGSSELKHLVELKVKDESQRSPVVTPSNRTNVDYKNLEQLGLKMLSGKAKEADQVAFAKEFFKTRGREL